MSTQDRKKAWFVEGLRLLPDKLMGIQSYHLSSILASRRCREKAAGDFVVFSMHYRNHPDVKAWAAYRADTVCELDAAVRIGGEFTVDLPSCRKLSIALSQGFYQDDSPLILDAITEVVAVADKLNSSAESDPWILVKNCDTLSRQKTHNHAKEGMSHIRKASRGFVEIRTSRLNEYVSLSVAKQYLQ